MLKTLWSNCRNQQSEKDLIWDGSRGNREGRGQLGTHVSEGKMAGVGEGSGHGKWKNINEAGRRVK